MYMLMIADEVVALGTELECYVAWQASDADYDCAHLDALVVALPVWTQSKGYVPVMRPSHGGMPVASLDYVGDRTMRAVDHGDAVVLWLSARDTERWASRPGAAWPCSTLAGKRIVAAFGRNGLCDLAIDGRTDIDCDAHELFAICADHLEQRIKPDHAVYFVTVGQFTAKA